MFSFLIQALSLFISGPIHFNPLKVSKFFNSWHYRSFPPVQFSDTFHRIFAQNRKCRAINLRHCDVKTTCETLIGLNTTYCVVRRKFLFRCSHFNATLIRLITELFSSDDNLFSQNPTHLCSVEIGRSSKIDTNLVGLEMAVFETNWKSLRDISLQ